nr:MAG: alanine dehydrogenase [Hyphomicrobiales bacterium]
MRIGVPREIKDNEFRVGMSPDAVRELTARGHQVLVEKNAGEPIGLHDAMYVRAGGTIVDGAAEVFGGADLIVKVKEPQPEEFALLRKGQTLFTYLHLASDPSLTQALLDAGIIGIAYETVTDLRGGLPLLSPMSVVAGRMSIQAGARCLEMEAGGRGQLLGGVPGVPAAKVTILGGGVVGTNAARIAMGMEAHVTLIDISLPRLYDLDLQFGAKLSTVYSTIAAIEEHVTTADLVVGAVLVPGATAPKLITEDMVKEMQSGSVIVDVAIDQGGCAETSRPTTHAKPTYKLHDVVHYCVTNMPGAVARTSTLALNNATLPFIIRLAETGAKKALEEDPNLRAGLNVYEGTLTYRAVAEAQGLTYLAPEDALGIR